MGSTFKLRLFVIALAGSLALSALIYFIYQYETEKKYVKNFGIEAQEINRAFDSHVQRKFESYASDIELIGLQMSETGGDFLNSTNPEVLSSLMRFARTRVDAQQVRFIDKFGMEQIRLESRVGGWVKIDSGKLQNKKKRYYFQRTMELSPGEVYVSPMDLNTEQGKIEIPFNPVVRFASPVFSMGGDLEGIVVVNYRVEDILSYFAERIEEKGWQLRVDLQDGAYMISSANRKNWKFHVNESGQMSPLDSVRTDSISPIKVGRNWEFRHVIELDDFQLGGSTILTGQERSAIYLVTYLSQENIRKNVHEEISAAFFAIIFFSIVLVTGMWLLGVQVGKNTTYKRQIEEQNQVLSDQVEVTRTILSVMAHDLRSPLASAIGVTEMLKSNPSAFTPDEIKELAKDLNKSSTGALKLLETMLKWANSKTGSLKGTMKLNNLKELLENSIVLLTSSAQLKDIEISIDANPDTTIFGDPEMFMTIFRNLLSNAIKFSPKNSTVKIVCKSEPSDKVRIDIIDKGVGMSDEQVNSLFAVSKNKSTPGTDGEVGTGMGIVLVKELVDLQQGAISVSSKPNKGTTFTLIFSKYKL